MNESDTHELLTRLDERVEAMRSEVHQVKGVLEKYVTRVEFWPVKVIVFGMAGLVLSSVLATVIALVIGARHG